MYDLLTEILNTNRFFLKTLFIHIVQQHFSHTQYSVFKYADKGFRSNCPGGFNPEPILLTSTLTRATFWPRNFIFILSREYQRVICHFLFFT